MNGNWFGVFVCRAIGFGFRLRLFFYALFSVFILMLLVEKNAHAGGEFDYIGYTASGIVSSVAKEFGVENEVRAMRVKSGLCSKFANCAALDVVAPFDKLGFLESLVIALAKPCAYAKVRHLYIKNPDVASSKASPSLDVKKFFCEKSSDGVSIVLKVTDSKNVFGPSSIVVVIRRDEVFD